MEEPPAPQGQRQPTAPTSGLSTHLGAQRPLGLLPPISPRVFFFPGLDANLHRSWLSTCQLVQFWPCSPKGRCLSVCLAAGALCCSWWQQLQLGVRRARRCLALLWCLFHFPGCVWVLCLRRMSRGAHRPQNNSFVHWYRFASPKNPEKYNGSKASQDALLCGSPWEYVPLARQTKSLEAAFNRRVKLNILISKNRGEEC